MTINTYLIFKGQIEQGGFFGLIFVFSNMAICWQVSNLYPKL